MSEKVENIGKKDVAWSYASTFFSFGAGVILLPFILHKLPIETVGLWNIFQTITALVLMLDFGFRPSFARNISYIFSGVKTLQRDGVAHTCADSEIDYGLLKGTLIAMQRFYRWMALAVFGILLTVGTTYFYYILQKYSGDRHDALIAWILLIAINCYNLYTYYYDALLTGKGYVRQIQQINIVGHAMYLTVAVALLYFGYGLIAIVTSQAISIAIRRFLAYRVFFTPELKAKIKFVGPEETKGILAAITPNAIKVGLTQLGGFLVNRSSILIGSSFLTLEEIASFGITTQIVGILAGCATVPYQSFIPKLAQCRAENNLKYLKHLYLFCTISLWLTFIVGGISLVLGGEIALNIIHSQTHIIPTAMLCTMLLTNALENNHVVSAGFISAGNKIPFFIPSLLSGAGTIVLLLIFLGPLKLGIWGLILAPGFAQLAYQNWKWPIVVIKEFK